MSAAANPRYNAPTLDDRVSRITQMLLGASGERRQDLAPVLGVSGPGVSGRMNGTTPWKVCEIEALANHFDVPPEMFLRDPAEVFDRARLKDDPRGTGGYLPLKIVARTDKPTLSEPRRNHLVRVQ